MKGAASLLAITALCNRHTSQAFAPPSLESFVCRTATTELDAVAKNTRRDFISNSIYAAATAATSTIVLSPLPSVADVSDGNLPKEAAQFSNVIKVREQLKSVTKRVTTHADEIDKKEWDGIDNFLRTVYSAGEDMKGIAKGMYDPEKKKKAEEDIKLLQNYVQAAQKPISKQDAAGFGAIAGKVDGLFEDFFDQLRDVPQDL